jgi:hypothetical protein
MDPGPGLPLPVLFRKNFGAGPRQKKFGPGQKTNFGPSPGGTRTTLPISSILISLEEQFEIKMLTIVFL